MPAKEQSQQIAPRLLRISEAAAYSGATSWFIRTKIWDGDIPHCKFGKRLLVDRADLDAFIDREKEKAL
jgi:excisionase family DNA binding protein